MPRGFAYEEARLMMWWMCTSRWWWSVVFHRYRTLPSAIRQLIMTYSSLYALHFAHNYAPAAADAETQFICPTHPKLILLLLLIITFVRDVAKIRFLWRMSRRALDLCGCECGQQNANHQKCIRIASSGCERGW